jgi:hypothetical protein
MNKMEKKKPQQKYLTEEQFQNSIIILKKSWKQKNTLKPGASEEYAVPAPHVAPVVLLLLQTG